MKRQRSYGDGLNEDRRRFYDRGPPPPPPPPRRPPPREYDGDRFDRGRKGFGGGGFHEGRHREYPSPREYGGERTMHRSESFSGFRREFPKGFRSERDRSRRDGDGSSAWRRSGSGWRDAECFDEYRAPTTTRTGAASLTAQPQRLRSRSPSEPRRRFEVSKAEKLKKQTACVSEMEEGEVAPDGEPKARPAAVENRKLVEPSRAREKGLERGKVKKLDSEAPTDLGAQCKGATGAADPYNAGKEEGRRIDGPPAEAGKPIDQGSGKSLLKVEEEVGVGEEVQAQDVVTGDGMLAEAGKPIDQGSEKYLSKVEEEVGVGEEVQAQDVVIGDGMLAEAGKPIDQGSEMHLLKVEEEVGGGDEVQAQDVVTGDASKFGLSTSPMQQEVLQEEVNQQKETANSVDFVGQSTSSSILKEVIQEGATTREEIFNGINDARNSSPSSFSQGAMQDEVMLAHKTDSAAADVGKSTSSIMRQEMLQEEALSLDSTAYAVDKVGKSAAPGMLQEVLREEVMQHDGTANAVDRIETGTSSDLLHEAPQEKMTILDETAHNIDTLEPTSYSCMLKEAMREGELTMDGTANTTGVAGQSNSSDMMGEAMHEKTAVLEGTVNIVNTTGESDTPTGLQREVIASLLTAEESEKITVTGEKDKSTEYVALQTEEEVPLEMNLCEKGGASEETMIGEKEVAVLHENVEKQVKEIDIEAKADGSHLFPRSTKKHAGNSKEDDARGNLMTRESMAEDRGNGIAFDVLSKKVEVEHSSLVGRDLDSAVQLGMEPTETSKSAPIASVKQENDTIKIGKLDLSLSLSGCLQNSEFKCSVPKTASLVHAACSQSLPSSSFHTNSYGFTASMTSSQTLGQNPICSLTQQSLDNHDHSVGSKPFFVGVDQMSNCTGRQVQLSSESTQKGSAPLLQRVLQNGHMADTNTLSGIKRHNNGISNGLRSHTNIPIVLSPTHSSGSHNSGLEHSRHIKQLKREKSSSSLTSGGRQEGEQIVINGAGVIERIISKVISEPLHLTVRMLQEMTENSITFLRKAISEIIVDPDRRVQIIALQEALKKRSDLNSDTLRTCPRVLMEILVAIKTGLPYFIKKSSSVATSNLVDIFLNLKCRNLSCQSILPVDDCDCKVCQRKTGFCSSCMCIVCSKFDSASNTCSWVGCDVCLHWCHTDCGLRQSLIRKGQSASRTYGTTEMQFHCTACGHPSKMFGFVKEVFQTCVRQWRMETLIKELQYVERIFSGSDDVRGKRVRDFVKRMLIESQNRANHPEVVKCVVAFFSDDDANLGINPSVPLKGIPCSIDEPIYGIPSSSRKAAWAPFTLEGLPVLDKTAVLSTTGSPSVHRKSGEAEFHTISNKPAIDELDSLIRLKQAEAYMYQERANDARNEVDHLRHIIMVKNARIEEDYATQIADLDLNELQERRKRQIEELLVIERTHHEFASMKTRMVASTRELLAKMDALKQNRST